MSHTRECTCGKVITYSDKYSYQRSLLIPNWICRSCKRTELNHSKPPMRRDDNPAWKGYKGMPYRWFSKYFERGGKKRTGTITIEDCYNVWVSQEGKCALSGVALSWGEEADGTFHISIDRIDSSKEYELSNIQLVHKDVNLMKNHFPQEYFIETCRRIAEKVS